MIYRNRTTNSGCRPSTGGRSTRSPS